MGQIFISLNALTGIFYSKRVLDFQGTEKRRSFWKRRTFPFQKLWPNVNKNRHFPNILLRLSVAINRSSTDDSGSYVRKKIKLEVNLPHSAAHKTALSSVFIVSWRLKWIDLSACGVLVAKNKEAKRPYASDHMPQSCRFVLRATRAAWA